MVFLVNQHSSGPSSPKKPTARRPVSRPPRVWRRAAPRELGPPVPCCAPGTSKCLGMVISVKLVVVISVNYIPLNW